MKEDFILKVIEKFEKGDTVVLQIKQDDCELILKKEGASRQLRQEQPGKRQRLRQQVLLQNLLLKHHPQLHRLKTYLK